MLSLPVQVYSYRIQVPIVNNHGDKTLLANGSRRRRRRRQRRRAVVVDFAACTLVVGVCGANNVNTLLQRSWVTAFHYPMPMQHRYHHIHHHHHHHHILKHVCSRNTSQRYRRRQPIVCYGTTNSNNNRNPSNNNKYSTIDIEDVIDDPGFLDRKNNPKYKNYKLDANYDNDFDASAFKNTVEGALYSCVVDYGTLYNGDITAIPYMSRYDSDSTWINYGKNDEVVQPAGTYGQLKENLANTLKDPRVEVTVAFSVLLSCLLVAISTFENFTFRSLLLYVEDGITAIFAMDFFGRWVSSNKDFGQHVLNAQFAIDVVVVVIPLLFALLPENIDRSTLWIPEYMTSPSALINLELLRVLRLRRVFQDMKTFTKFERALGIRNSGVQVWQLQLARVLFSLFTLLSVSTGLIYTAEHVVNPAIPNYFTALYFSISTLATLGLGDITPITWQGRLVVCGTIVAGVAVVPAQAAALVEALVSRKDSSEDVSLKRPKRSPNVVNGSSSSSSSSSTSSNGRFQLETSNTCSNCGVTMHWTSARFCWSCGAALTLE
jgi:Ion channel